MHHSLNLYRQLVGYVKVTSGSTCERITSKTECEEAARQLGESDTEASEETSTGYPPYCYLYQASSLYMNNDGNSATECSSSNVCICKDGKDVCMYVLPMFTISICSSYSLLFFFSQF